MMTEITGCSPSLLAFDASVTFPVHALNVSGQELATCVGVPRLAPVTSRYMLLKPRRDRSLKGGFGVSGMIWHSACLPYRSASLRESANGPQVRFKCVSDRDAELIEATLPILIANGL